MKSTAYEQVIVRGIRGLPPSSLAEVADFVCFVRKRVLRTDPLERELKKLSREEEAHLEKEFADYERRDPPE